MSYRQTIDRITSELPVQIRLIEEWYATIQNSDEYEKKMDDLRAYEKRMRDGLDFLKNISDEQIITAIENIRNPSDKLLMNNRDRYITSLREYRTRHDIRVTENDLDRTIGDLRKIPLTHTTKNPDEIQRRGIHPASELWLTPYKSCANAMDIVAGLDRCVFFTHGFPLVDYGDSFVGLSSELIDRPDCFVSTLDLFAFVLIRTGKVAPCAIQTQEWIDSLEEYSKNIFRGHDFWEIKAEYILTFFSSVEEYTAFAQKQFYANSVNNAPEGEYPFVWEVKIFSAISPDQIVQ